MTKKKKKKRRTVHIKQNYKYYSFYIFTQQVLQHFHKTFIFSCYWSHFIFYYFILTYKKLTP